jgi:hypothetical protein
MTNFPLYDEQTINGLRKIAWASVYRLKRQHIYYGAVIFQVGNASGIFGLEKDFQDYFIKGIYLYFERFLLIWGFVLKNVKNDPSERLHFFLEIGHFGYINREVSADFENVNIPY